MIQNPRLFYKKELFNNNKIYKQYQKKQKKNYTKLIQIKVFSFFYLLSI